MLGTDQRQQNKKTAPNNFSPCTFPDDSHTAHSVQTQMGDIYVDDNFCIFVWKSFVHNQRIFNSQIYGQTNYPIAQWMKLPLCGKIHTNIRCTWKLVIRNIGTCIVIFTLLNTKITHANVRLPTGQCTDSTNLQLIPHLHLYTTYVLYDCHREMYMGWNYLVRFSANEVCRLYFHRRAD